MTKLIDRTGHIYGRFIVLSLDASNQKKDARWICRCECGTIKSILAMTLSRGDSKSCGCLLKELASIRATTHGQTKSMEHRSWDSMRQRCNNSKHHAFTNYGGRGIKICERWSIFENFLEDMGPRRSLKYSLDRINNDGNYEPENCRWATEAEQKLNRSDSHIIEFNGVKKNLCTWAKENGISFSALSQRLKAGWDFERAIKQPLRVISRHANTRPQ